MAQVCVCICILLCVNMNIVCVLKNQSDPDFSLTRPTGDDVMTVKQGFLLEQQNTLCSSVRVKPASVPAMPADFFIRAMVVVILAQTRAQNHFQEELQF